MIVISVIKWKASLIVTIIIIFFFNMISSFIMTRFESGNLEKAVRITDTYYELYLRFVINNIIAITNIITILILATKNTL